VTNPFLSDRIFFGTRIVFLAVRKKIIVARKKLFSHYTKRLRLRGGAHRYVNVKSFLGDGQIPQRVPVAPQSFPEQSSHVARQVGRREPQRNNFLASKIICDQFFFFLWNLFGNWLIITVDSFWKQFVLHESQFGMPLNAFWIGTSCPKGIVRFWSCYKAVANVFPGGHSIAPKTTSANAASASP